MERNAPLCSSLNFACVSSTSFKLPLHNGTLTLLHVPPFSAGR